MRILLVSITHGLSFSVLVRRNDGKRYALPLIVMTVVIAVIGSFFVLISQNPVLHSSLSAVMMLFVLGSIFCRVSNAFSITERVFIYIMYVAVFMLSVGYAGIISKAFFREDAELAQLAIRTVFSVVFIILGLCVLAYAIFSFFFVDDMLMNAIVLALLTLMVISIFAIANTIVQLTSRELEMERATGRQRLLESELEAERVFVERAKAIRHDQRHHDRTVLEYLDEGNIEEAKRYLGAHDESVVSEGLASWCGNPLVDAQLRIAWRCCASRSIAFSADIQLPDGIGVDDIDFVSVMGNLLENAIQAASVAAEPSVSVSSRVSGGKLLLEIGNSFSGTAPLEEGTGLESVRYILSRYGGLLSQSGSDGFFVSRVIMPICN